MNDVTDVLGSLATLAWPILIGFVVWRLLPTIREVINSRGFTIKAGSAEITVQQASDQLLGRVEDLREQVSALKSQVAGIDGVGAAEASPISTGVPQLHRILWVDDHPENNAYEVEALQRKGVIVERVKSTGEGLRATTRADSAFDAIITDMGREEKGEERPDAGIELVKALQEQKVTTPIFVYASARAISRTGDELAALGVKGTASATELLEMLGRLKPA